MKTSPHGVANAAELRDSGALEEAESLCREILRHDPLHVGALHILGTVLHREQKLEEAARTVGRAIAVSDELARRQRLRADRASHGTGSPHGAHDREIADRLTAETAVYYGSLGKVFEDRGDVPGALECYQRSLRIAPTAETHVRLGRLFEKHGDPTQATAHYRSALAIEPGLQEAAVDLAGLCYRSGQSGEAESVLRDAVHSAPKNAELIFEYATLLMNLKAYESAETQFRALLALDPQHGRGWANLGVTYQWQGRREDAFECYRQAAEFEPDVPQIQNNLGLVLRDRGRHDEAIACFERALALNPSYGDACANLAAVHKDLDALPRAERYYRRALELAPPTARTLSGLAICVAEQGRFEEARPLHLKALEVDPSLSDVHQNYAILLLLTGNLAEGWDEYRWRREWAGENRHAQSEWDGRATRNGKLLVTAEQGVGDQILFASCLPDASAAGNCRVECEPRLVPLFQRSFPDIEFVAASRTTGPRHGSSCDATIRIGSLPRLFRRDLNSFPNRPRFLVADPQNVERWKRRYAALGEGLKVGISWRGGKKLNHRRRKSTCLNDWSEILSVPGVQFVNLQYGETARELAEVDEQAGVTIHDWDDADSLVDLDDFAAQIAALDLVISVSNVSVHVAGGLGVPVWVMLPFVPDWRWLLDRTDSPWYRSARLFRQRRFGDWSHPLAEVASELARRAA